jgi:hypothetical protein
MSNTLDGNFLQSLTSRITGVSPKLVFTSNLTPEISLNLLELLQSDEGSQPATEIVEEGGTTLKLIRPEVIVEGLGRRKSFAPYGRPYAGMFGIILGSMGVIALISGLIAWHICRNKIVSKKQKKLIRELRGSAISATERSIAKITEGDVAKIAT